MAISPSLSGKSVRRRALRAARAAFVAGLDHATRTELERALAHRALSQLQEAAIVAGYHACGDEIDPMVLIAMLRQRGTVIAYPRVAENGATIGFHACNEDALEPGFKGIMEPPATAPQVSPDVVLVPLVGIDLAGNRIGQGAGHYDRSLGARPVRTLGLAWDVQIIGLTDFGDTIAAAPWDRPLDGVATPQRLVLFAAETPD